MTMIVDHYTHHHRHHQHHLHHLFEDCGIPDNMYARDLELTIVGTA